MAQNMLQMSRMWHDIEYEDVQRIQQITILRSVSTEQTLNIYIRLNCFYLSTT